MSAFMVSNAHISALVYVAINGPDDIQARQWSPAYFGNPSHRSGDGNASKLGAMLLRENHASYVSRYPQEKNTDSGADTYQYTAPTSRITTLQALNLVQCFEYQACERDVWNASDAYHFCHTLTSRLVSELPGIDATRWTF